MVDDLSTGSLKNVQHFSSHPKMMLYVASVSNIERMAELVGWLTSSITLRLRWVCA